jgi:hypothetical protein
VVCCICISNGHKIDQVSFFNTDFAAILVRHPLSTKVGTKIRRQVAVA